MKKHALIFVLGTVLALVNVPTKAAQQVTKSQAQPSEVPLKNRVTSYYQDILKDDRAAALDMVAPESKNQFFRNRDDGLTDVRIVGYDFDPSGDRANVKVVRVRRVPGFGQPLDLEFEDVWQRIDGQWYLVLPPADEMDTPFGKIKFNTENKPDDATAEAMKQKIQERYRSVDPEQYLRALQKAASNKPAVEHPVATQPAASGTDGNQQPVQPAPPPSGDEPKSHSQ